MTPEFFMEKMRNRIVDISWDGAKTDVERFLDTEAQKSLKLWSDELFLDKLEKLERLISGKEKK